MTSPPEREQPVTRSERVSSPPYARAPLLCGVVGRGEGAPTASDGFPSMEALLSRQPPLSDLSLVAAVGAGRGRGHSFHANVKEIDDDHSNLDKSNNNTSNAY